MSHRCRRAEARVNDVWRECRPNDLNTAASESPVQPAAEGRRRRIPTSWLAALLAMIGLLGASIPLWYSERTVPVVHQEVVPAQVRPQFEPTAPASPAVATGPVDRPAEPSLAPNSPPATGPIAEELVSSDSSATVASVEATEADLDPKDLQITGPDADPLADLSDEEVESALAAELDAVPDLDPVFPSEGPSGLGASKFDGLVARLRTRPDLEGLAWRDAGDCQSAPGAVRLSRLLSSSLFPLVAFQLRAAPLSSEAEISSGDSVEERRFYVEKQVLSNFAAAYQRPDAVPALEQMLQVQGGAFRLKLVEILAGIGGRDAALALARRAVFDLSRGVREAAAEALGTRPPEQFRQELLRGLGHPWPPAASHAAQALARVGDRHALPALLDMLDDPAPTAPVQDPHGKWTIRELVRVNHFRNCLLCHPVSQSTSEPLRGLVPTPGQPIPVAYYAGRTGGTFVRADVTYLKQDFSVMHDVPDSAPWPYRQRFDYLVRTRAATPWEIDAHLAGSNSQPRDSYRGAVLLALRELTGLDAGPSSIAWRGLLEASIPSSPRKP